MTQNAISRGTVMALVAMAAGVFLIANDFTALSVAIPAIEAEFGTSLSTAQWVINGYTVVFGVLVVTGGRLADMFGRRRIFVVGAVIFASFSLLGAFAPSIEILILSRVLMGIGGALLWPAILGMTYAILPAERAGLAGGLIIGVAGLGNAFGPLLGGVLTDTLGWAWVFLLNVPITIVAVWITLRYVPETQMPDAERHIDVGGIATLSTGVIALLVALDTGTSVGFTDPGTVLLFGIGIVMLVAFVFVERRQGDGALVPPNVLRNRQFLVAATMTLMLSAIFFAAIIYLPQIMEKQFGFSAVEAGAGLLPLMLVFMGTSFVAGALYDRLGARVVVSTGAAALGSGILLLSFVDANSSFMDLVPGMLVLGLGVGLFYSSITTTAVTAVEPSQSSLAGGIVYMCQIGGGSVGLGINTAIVVSAASLTEGMAMAFRVDALLALGALIIGLLFLNSTGSIRERLHVRHSHRAHAP